MKDISAGYKEAARRGGPSGKGNAWYPNPHGIQIASQIKTLKENLQVAMAEQVALETPEGKAAYDTLLGNVADNESALPAFMSGNTFGYDTSVGGCDAINCQWQFNWDDDIVPEAMMISGSRSGLGRVYSEMYQSNQQMLWLKFGVPRYRGLGAFMSDAADSGQATLMNNGTGTWSVKVGELLGKTINLAVTLPFKPFTIMYSLVNNFVNTPITKYYEFKPAMPIYYRMVNTMMSHLAINMGLTNPGDLKGKEGQEVKGNTPYLHEAMRDMETLDIYTILNKVARRRANSTTASHYDTERHFKDFLNHGRNKKTTPVDIDYSALSDKISKEALAGSVIDTKASQEGAGIFDYFRNVMKDTVAHATGATEYIGFRIEKGSDSSESVSNSTGESGIASKLNAATSSARNTKFDLAGGNIFGGAVGEALTAAKDAAFGAFDALTGGTGVTATTKTMATGGGQFDIPEVWQSSSFSKNYSFDIDLRARYGDPVSIYQSIYIPLCMLLCAGLPRQIGKNAYTQPFLLQAYSKGMFAVPLGMIDSLSIKRGDSEFGWTYNNLPTVISVSMSIKDLSPAFYAGMATPGFLESLFASNSNMQEYLMTLAGLGVADRSFGFRKARRRMEAWWKVTKDNWFSAAAWSTDIGNHGVTQTLANVLPGWSTPNGQ